MATAVITMVYNEPEFLPLWVGYYGSQFPREHLYVIDHGSDDSSTSDLPGVNVIRIPRTHKDNQVRTEFVNALLLGLLKYYDNVVHVDVDEFLVPDVRKYASLADYCARAPAATVTAIGLNIVQSAQETADVDLSRPVLSQRRFAQFVSPMCKPCLTSVPVTFLSGFHGHEKPPVFADLHLLHLRYFDLKMGLDRLARTRAMAWSSESAGRHQRVEDAEWIKQMRYLGSLKPGGEIMTPEGDEALKPYLDQAIGNARPKASGLFDIDPQVRSGELFRIPSAIEAVF